MCIIAILSVALIDCGNTEITDKVDNTEIPGINETETIVYEEKTDIFLISNNVYGQEYVDGKQIDMSTLKPAAGRVITDKEINIFNQGKELVGYIKSGITVKKTTESNEWIYVTVTDGSFLVRAEDIKDLVVVFGNQVNTNNNENSITADDEPTYTVADISKTMYAKQSVNLRSGPSTDYEKVGSLNTNDEVVVTGQANNGWYRIDYNGGVAFVSDNYLSDAKVEIALPDDGGNTNENENNGEEEYTPPTDDDIIYIPEEPKYTVDEVISIVKSTLESNGIICSTDYAPPEAIEEFGADLGMGWGIDWVPMDDPYTYANSMVEGFQYWGFDMYYIYYEGIENGCVRLKTHWGTRGQ